MRVSPLTVALTAAALLIPMMSSAQSLAEVAAKEKERRKGKSGRTLTEEDLRRAGASRQREGTTSEGAAAPPAEGAAPDAKSAKEGAPKAKTADEVRADQEKAWRDRLTKANDDVSKLSGQIDTMQRALNDASQNLYGPGRATQIARMEDAKKQLVTAQQSVADLQEEGRRSSFRQ
jgi:hypothetical protein